MDAALPAQVDSGDAGPFSVSRPDFRRRPPMGLYVHLPWCIQKCPYCDFNSFAIGDGPVPEREYVDALLLELEGYCSWDAWPAAGSIFLGGGTPSLFSPGAIERLLSGIGDRLRLSGKPEVTLEANPSTVERGRFTEFRQAGINRLSIGVQSFNHAALARIGRIHTAEDAIRATEDARRAGFDNLNLDLMFGLPEQGRTSALADLEIALSLEPGHVSRYQLTIEPDTAFGVHPPSLPSDDEAWEMQEAGQRMLMHRGYTRYEVSAFAAPGRQCRHNRNYWEFGDYIGLGAGAHGKLTDPARQCVMRTQNPRSPRAWMNQVHHRRTVSQTPVAVEDLPLEFILNAFRLVEGFSYSLFEERTGLPREVIRRRIAGAQAEGLLREEGDQLIPTPLGYRFLNDLIARFLPG